MATATEAPVEIEEEVSAVPGPVEPAEEYEIVNGQILEEPYLAAYEHWSALELIEALILFNGQRRLGKVHSETLFILEESPRLRRRPDVAFVSYERWPAQAKPARKGAWPAIPDLAVEVISPTDLIQDIMDKLDEYFRAGVRVVWVVHPVHELVYNYDSPTSVMILKRGDVLDGGTILPGFQMALDDLFGEAKKDEPTPGA